MAPTPSLKVVKTFTYRGVTRQFSNRYHFAGGVPADASHWHTLMDNVTASEKTMFPSAVQIVEAIGYAAGSEVPVATKTYALAGTCVAGGILAQGDTAALLRYSTAARSTKNHPVYLFNYFHACNAQSGAGNSDKPDTTQAAAIATYAAAWISGFSDGAVTYNRAGPNGAAATGSVVETYLTHRDLPR